MTQEPPPLPADEASRILLVDDDATNLEVLRQALDGHGYRLFVARNGEDALKVARRARPLLVLLDVVMPGMDGYEVCRRIKEDAAAGDTAVIFLSALSDAKDKVRGFEAGAVDFITKPFEADEVIARVNTHVTIQRVLRRQLGARPTGTSANPPTPDDQPTRHRGEGRKTPGASSLNAGDVGAEVAEAALEPVSFDGFGPHPGGSVFRPGEVVAYRFRIVRYLAKGGMGELYEAEDLELHERVALKTILSKIAEDERTILMFKREVHLARQVTHPNVCRIFDVFRHRPQPAAGDDGQVPVVVFLAMELLHGETLADRLQREGRLPIAEALPLVRQMAAGLAAAHRVGVVHRDFKSHNVMLVNATPTDPEIRVVVTDFGLAKRRSDDDRSSLSISLNDEGEVSGTPAYMAPEQVEGGPVTPATDVYALGVVIYEMITGMRPFVGDTPLKIAVKRLQESPPTPRVHLPDLDARWEATILRCLARQPGERFATVGEAVAALEGDRVEPKVAGQGQKGRAPGLLARILAGPIGSAHFGRARFGGRGEEGIASLAVLPFTNAGSDTEGEHFSDGISESLIRRLSKLPGVKVIASTSSSKYKGEGTDPQEVARALGVAGILTGRVSQRGDDLSITVELIDARDRTQVWGERYDRKVADLPKVQAEISEEIAEQLRTRLTAG